MQNAVRSYLSGGVAMVAATALIAAPISASPPDIRVPAIYSAQVSLAAATDPITPWVNVIGDAVANVVGIGTAVASDPAPALRQLIINALGYGQTIVTGLTGATESFITWATDTVPTSLKAVATNLAQGNVTVAAEEVNNLIVSVLLAAFPLFDVLAIPSKIVDSLGRVVTTLTSLETILPLVSGILSPVMSVVAALGAQGQAVVDSLGQGDLLSAFSAMINTPAAVTGAFLNGYEDSYPGLLTFIPTSPGAGLLGALLVAIPRAIAEALKPPTVAPVAASTVEDPTAEIAVTPDVSAAMITVDTTAVTVVETSKADAEAVSNTVAVAESPEIDSPVDGLVTEIASDPEAGATAPTEDNATDSDESTVTELGNSEDAEADGDTSVTKPNASTRSEAKKAGSDARREQRSGNSDARSSSSERKSAARSSSPAGNGSD